MIAKVGLGLVGIGAIGIGGVAFTKPEWLGINKETKWAPLSKDSGYEDAEGIYKDKFGSTHKNYLVGLDKVNEDWWKEKYESIKGQSRGDGKFKDVSNGYGITDKDLKKVCEEAYKKGDGDFHAGSEADNGDKFKKEEVWKYCSYIGEKPKTINDTGTAETDYPAIQSKDSIGKSKKDELLSVKEGDNEKLWKLKNDEFFGLGVFGSAQEPTEEFFKALFKGGNKGKNSLRNKCKEAYKLASKEPSDTNQPKDDDVVKYCSAKSIKQ